MNKRKLIYFFSAIVLIIGCYILNYSYSLFVQTEEREVVSSIVPVLNSELSISDITLEPNKEYIIKETIKNTGTVSLNYALYIKDFVEDSNIIVELLDNVDNLLIGTIDFNSSKDIYLYIKNNNLEETTSYTTLKNILTSNISDEVKYTAMKTAMPYYDKENTLEYNILSNYVSDNEITETLLTNEDLDRLTNSNNILTLPLYNDNVVDELKGNLNKIMDNDGISYYYLDNPNNNYVSFGGYIWRVVRINGNGTIRLITNNDIDKISFDEKDKSNKSYKNNIEDIINKWYEDNLIEYGDLLSNEVFCINNNEDFLTPTSLECETDNIYNLNNSLKYPIATISMEEVALTGINSYLSSNMLTMTLYKDKNLFVIKDGKLNTTDNEILYGIRPIINIKSNLIVGGSGTISDPYIVLNS